MIEFRLVKGYFNPMAVCAECRRDATQARMTRYCIAAINHTPLRCDECELAGVN